jgi:hypothetical protein
MTTSNKSMGEKYMWSSRAHWHLVITFSKPRISPATGWDKTLSTQLYSARLTRQEKNKMTSRICMVYLVELIGWHNFAKEHY